MIYVAIFILLLVTIVGYVVGRHMKAKQQFQIKQHSDEKLYLKVLKNLDNRLSIDDAVKRFNLANYEQALRSIKEATHYPLTVNDRIQLLRTGDEKFPALYQALEEAKHNINILYYTINDDQTGQTFIDMLIKKAKAGVQVRLLVDGLGSRTFSKSEEYTACKKAGIACQIFSPTKPAFFIDLNFRNHRKIVVIDGRIAFTGGLNVGDEYVHKDKNKGYWRDIHVLIEGESVLLLQRIFATDWMYATHEQLAEDERFFPQYTETGTHKNKTDTALIQVIPSGPDMKTHTLKAALKDIILSAQNRIWLGTPYFVPDKTVMDALQEACAKGIDVRLLIPKRTDSTLVQYASYYYLEELMYSGARIYCYEKGFYHSKIALIDNHICKIGSSNYDNRSFHYNFEDDILIYHQETCAQVQQIFEEDLQNCYRLQFDHLDQRKIWERVATKISLSLAPWL